MQKTQLFLVGVPIGHFDDMTFRALETLKKVDVIAAEVSALLPSLQKEHHCQHRLTTLTTIYVNFVSDTL